MYVYTHCVYIYIERERDMHPSARMLRLALASCCILPEHCHPRLLLLSLIRKGAVIRGNHLSNTTCLKHVFFRNSEYCSIIW